MASPITQLKALGCKVVDRETTTACQKWWLTVPDELTRTAILNELGIPHPEFHEKAFRLVFQTEAEDGFSGILISKVRNTRAGQMYREGWDDLALQDLGI